MARVKRVDIRGAYPAAHVGDPLERYEQPELAKEQMKILFAQPYQQPRDIARWLNLMADWHLKKDNLDAARKCLQQIVAQFPDQPYSDEAQLRLTRLNT